MILNLIYDSFALAAPQSFRDGMATAANLLIGAIHDNVTINIDVGYGEFNSGPLFTNQNISLGGDSGFSITYSNLRALLASHETSAADITSVNVLPNTTTLNGQSSFVIGTAEARALGALPANNGTVDGLVGMGTNFTGSVLVGGALHELTHAMGRVPGASGLSLFRYTSQGNHLFTSGTPAAASYFSIDGGVTKLADFGVSSDPGDFLNSPGSNLTPNDPFDEGIAGSTLTSVDLTMMDVLGFNVTSSSPPPPAPIISIAALDASKAEGNSGATPFTFTVTRSGSTSGTNTVQWQVAFPDSNPNNATGSDFVGGSFSGGLVTFNPGDTAPHTITVNVQGDTTVEPNEPFAVVLSSPSGGATIGTGTALGTIINDDVPPSFTVLVNSVWYDAQYPDVAAAGVNPALHYYTYGWHEGRNPDAYFSTTGYLNTQPDVRAAGVDPLIHYDQYGWTEGRDPSWNFDTQYYLIHAPDVAAAHVDPLEHYLQYGAGESRLILPAVGPKSGITPTDFDREYYLMANPDVAAAGVDPYQHFLTYGWHEGRNPNGLFDTSYYLSHNRDVAAAGVAPLLHYDQYGWREGRDPSALFSTNGYLAANPDVAGAHVDPLDHFLRYGLYEGRLP
jgi:hypothetical protein